jgi:hypothetical protein
MIISFKTYRLLLEEKNYQELYKVYYSEYKSLDGVQMTDELGEALLNADPTENKEYRQWIFNMFKKYDLSEFKIELIRLYENRIQLKINNFRFKDYLGLFYFQI